MPTPSTPGPTPAWLDALAHRRLVESVAGEFAVSAFDRDDLVSEGMIGLRRAAARHRERHGAAPAAARFLRTTARNAMLDWLGWRDGRSRRTGKGRWRGGDAGLDALLSPPPWADDDTVASLLAGIEADLDPRERATILSFYGIGTRRLDPVEIAAALGIARETVHRVRLRAAEKLRCGLITP